MKRKYTAIFGLVASVFLLPAGATLAADAKPDIVPNLGAAKTAMGEKDYARALANLRPLAEAGDSEAEGRLGLLFLNGWGVAKDEAAAAAWFRKAADAGNVGAEIEMGRIYLLGRGVMQDDAQAAQWFGKAAEAGNAFGQEQLGYAYLAGRGIAKDSYTGLDWMTRSAAQGNAAALRNIAAAYLSGEGVEKNPRKAIFWLATALQRANPGQHDMWMPQFRNLAAKFSAAEALKQALDAAKWTPSPDGVSPVMADAMAFRDGAPPKDQKSAPKDGI